VTDDLDRRPSVIPLAVVSLGSRNEIHVTWLPSGDEHTRIPSLEIARHRIGPDGSRSFVGSIIVRASNDIRELASALDTAAASRSAGRPNIRGALSRRASANMIAEG
jgi:hypothetical protein